MKKKLENKTVLITGHLTEVGKTCALAALREGANVIIADIISDRTEIVMAEIRKEHSNVHFIPCDTTNYDAVNFTVKKVITVFGSVDVALNNTGIDCEIKPEEHMSKEAWLKIIGNDLNGVFNCMTHQLLEMAKQKKGVILNMASVFSDQNFSTSSHYIATKHGIIGLTKTAAAEYAAYGIRINALCPGTVAPTAVDKMEDVVFAPGSRKQHTMNLTAIRKKEKAKEIANGFIFMASEKSPFITGTAVEIDGGYLSQ
ncbi:MAG: SDR family NAD(P)-dependent oxidoreductase [Bacteroidota bacterium]